MKLLAPSMYIMSKVSMDPIPEIISVLLSPALKLFTGILSVFSTADGKSIYLFFCFKKFQDLP